MRWPREAADMLEHMWLWGVSSGNIATNMAGGISRNAVMGKVNSLGLMGRGGERLRIHNMDSGLSAADIEEAAGEMLFEAYDGDKALHRNAAVAVAALFAGRDVKAIDAIVGHDDQEIARILDELHETSVWRKGNAPPNAWWHHSDGAVSFMLDMMACARMIAIANPDIRDTNERSYKAVWA